MAAAGKFHEMDKFIEAVFHNPVIIGAIGIFGQDEVVLFRDGCRGKIVDQECDDRSGALQYKFRMHPPFKIGFKVSHSGMAVSFEKCGVKRS